MASDCGLRIPKRFAVRSAIDIAPGTTRTCDPQLRRLLLYPTELREHKGAIFDVSGSSKSSQPLGCRTSQAFDRFNHLVEYLRKIEVAGVDNDGIGGDAQR